MAVVDSIFDGIRPYYDSEIPASVVRMQSFEYLDDIADFLNIEGGGDTLRNALANCRTVDDFQDKIMALVMEHVLSRTTAGVEYSGLELFDSGKKHLILTNHRDIVLDSAIIQLLLLRNRKTTTEIAVGDNLITSQFIEDVARSNKMIKVTRSSLPREVYNSSLLLSKYMRHQIETDTSSIWIAQRQGRTKDGLDLTEQGLLKMVQMSGSGDFLKDMDSLSILPAAISYEFEPCDGLKAREIFVSRRHQYVKQPGEDLNSILTGMKSWKGRIKICFTPPLSYSEVETCSRLAKNERFVELGKIIDKRIHSEYHLWPNNFIAADILKSEKGETAVWGKKYGKAQKETFLIHMQEQIDAVSAGLMEDKTLCLDSEEQMKKEMEDIFLHIYANPVEAAARL